MDLPFLVALDVLDDINDGIKDADNLLGECADSANQGLRTTRIAEQIRMGSTIFARGPGVVVLSCS